MRRSVRRRVPGGAGQHPRFNPVRDLVAFAAAVPGEQSGQPLGRKTLTPATDIAVAAVQCGANLSPGEAVGQQQNQPRVPRGIRSSIPCTGLLLQFHPFALGQFHRALHERNDTTYLNVTNH